MIIYWYNYAQNTLKMFEDIQKIVSQIWETAPDPLWIRHC